MATTDKNPIYSGGGNNVPATPAPTNPLFTPGTPVASVPTVPGNNLYTAPQPTGSFKNPFTGQPDVINTYGGAPVPGATPNAPGTSSGFSEAAGRSDLQGADYFNNLAQNGTPAEKVGALSWLARHQGTPTAPATTTTTNPNPGIVSSTNARNDITTGGAALDKMTNTPDPYLEYLQKRVAETRQESEPGVEEKNIAYNAGKEKQSTEDMFAKYKAGLEALGIQSGLSRYAPSLQADRVLNAEISEKNKLADIQDKEDLAIAKAKQARLDNDAKKLKEALDEVKDYKKEKADELQAQLAKRTQDITVAKSLASYAIQHLAALPADQKEKFINEIAAQNNIDPTALISAMTEEQRSRYEFGVVHSKSSSASGGYTPQELRKLREAGIDSSNTTLADNYLYGDNKGTKPADFTKSKILEEYGKKDVWKLAQALGVPRKKNLSKNDEIDSLFANPQYVSYIQEQFALGQTVDDIISSNQ